MFPFKKGEAIANYPYRLLDSDLNPVTTGTTTGKVIKDGVSQVMLANGTHISDGVWVTSFTANETNGSEVLFLPVNASAVTLGMLIPTYEQLDSNLTQVNGSPAVLNDFKADVSGLGTLANQTTINNNVLTRLSTSDYTSTSLVVDGKLDVIIADTNELQANQGDWATATGFSTFDAAADIVARVTLVDTTTLNTDMRGTDGANTVAPDNATIADTNAKVTAIDTSGLATTAQLNDRTVPSAQYSTLVATDIVTAGAITTNAGVASAAITEINGRTITGNGSTEPFDVL